MIEAEVLAFNELVGVANSIKFEVDQLVYRGFRWFELNVIRLSSS